MNKSSLNSQVFIEVFSIFQQMAIVTNSWLRLYTKKYTTNIGMDNLCYNLEFTQINQNYSIEQKEMKFTVW